MHKVHSRLEQLKAQVVPELRDDVRMIRLLLVDPEHQWIGKVEAQLLLDVQSISSVKAWAKLGILRSRGGLIGCMKVHLDDVLREAQAQRDLEMMGGLDDAEVANEAIRGVRQQLRDPAERACVDAVAAMLTVAVRE